MVTLRLEGVPPLTGLMATLELDAHEREFDILDFGPPLDTPLNMAMNNRLYHFYLSLLLW